jgi:hypothetical protein
LAVATILVMISISHADGAGIASSTFRAFAWFKPRLSEFSNNGNHLADIAAFIL